MSGWLHRLVPRSSPATTSSAHMFHAIRRRLTLWYTGVLAVSLLLFGLALYVGERQALLGPVDDGLKASAAQLADRCQTALQLPHPFGGPDFRGSMLWACYGRSREPVGASGLVGFAPRFTDPSIVSAAWRGGAAVDTIDGGSDLGAVRRYAHTLTDPDGNVLGVVVVGTPVGSQIDALNKLVALLLALGVLALLVAAVGGLFLAHRALLPARLAYARQRDFIADASHELRTPLTMLRADAEVLLRGRGRFQPDDVLLLQDVVTEAAHMGALADHMLDLARLDSDHMEIERDVVDLAEMARDVVRRVGPLAAERGLTVGLEDEPGVLVVGDRLLLEQVALVLVDNAIKYNRQGGEVRVRVSARGDEAQLEVRDTGIGIAPEHLPRLGERFYRVDKARSRETGGAGLGVSIAQRIAARHGGELRLDSELGQGTRAQLLLPLAKFRRGAPIS